jgi:hypothetical protein
VKILEISQHQFMMKTISKLGTERSYLNLIKSMDKNLLASFLLNVKL